jgi:hypothetical protein
MESRKIDLLNIFLIMASLMAAFWQPFGVFLFSYAILGPLHYLTEINWLEERNYFSKSSATPWVLGGFVLLICLASFFAEGMQNPTLGFFYSFVQQSSAKGFFEMLSANVVHLAFLSFVVAVSLAAFRDWKFRILVIFIGIAVATIFRTNNTYTILVGSMLPTIVHVGVFTGIFMLYGAIKSDSRPGFMAVITYILAHFVIVFFPIDASRYFLAGSSVVSETFVQSGFNNVLYQLGIVLGRVGRGSNFLVNSELGIRLGIFLAFSYTYHYLNWFSKTSVIRWHRVSKKKLVGALVIWLASIALYSFDYRIGLLALLFLSLLHVVLEFPLNFVSISGVVSAVRQKIYSALQRGADVG